MPFSRREISTCIGSMIAALSSRTLILGCCFPRRGNPRSPARLTLVLLRQFAEGLSDRQAADAVRTRIDWKYLLGLELTDPGFDFSVLSEFRQRLLEHRWAEHLLDQLLGHLRDQGLLKAHGQQRTDSTIILGAVRELNL